MKMQGHCLLSHWFSSPLTRWAMPAADIMPWIRRGLSHHQLTRLPQQPITGACTAPLWDIRMVCSSSPGNLLSQFSYCSAFLYLKMFSFTAQHTWTESKNLLLHSCLVRSSCRPKTSLLSPAGSSICLPAPLANARLSVSKSHGFGSYQTPIKCLLRAKHSAMYWRIQGRQTWSLPLRSQTNAAVRQTTTGNRIRVWILMPGGVRNRII